MQKDFFFNSQHHKKKIILQPMCFSKMFIFNSNNTVSSESHWNHLLQLKTVLHGWLLLEQEKKHIHSWVRAHTSIRAHASTHAHLCSASNPHLTQSWQAAEKPGELENSFWHRNYVSYTASSPWKSLEILSKQ